MVLSRNRSAFRRALKPFKTAQCAIYRMTKTGLATEAETLVACHYERTPPKPGGEYDVDAGNGLGYTVWFDQSITLADNDVIRVNGLEIQVQTVPEKSNVGPVDRIEGAMRRG
jgi:hypothetical protein